MIETIPVIVRPGENSSAVVEQYENIGWKYAGAGRHLVIFLEREVPDSPSPTTDVGASTEQSPPTEYDPATLHSEVDPLAGAARTSEREAAISRIINERTLLNWQEMRGAVNKVLQSDPSLASAIANEYCHARGRQTVRANPPHHSFERAGSPAEDSSNPSTSVGHTIIETAEKQLPDEPDDAEIVALEELLGGLPPTHLRV